MATSTALAGKALQMTVEEAVRAVGGALAAGNPYASLRGVSTDSRTTEAGNLFIAIPGENFDGHDYVTAAVARGAEGALIQVNKAEGLRSLGVPLIAVEGDVLSALASLARAHRERFAIPVVGITGSAGKTTAKEMTAAVLAGDAKPVLKTQGNLNNRIGVPLTVLSIDREHGAAVIEMGISLPGEMKELARAARPTVRVVLNAGTSHVEFLKDADGVAAEKATLWDGAEPEDWLIFNADDPRLVVEAERRPAKNRLSFGRTQDADVRLTECRPTALGEQLLSIDLRGGGFGPPAGGARPRGKTLEVRLKAFGAHLAENALAATAVGLALDLPLHYIVEGLESRFRPVPGRGDVHLLDGDVVLIDDSYNSNPTSLGAALAALGGTRRAGRTRAIAALGDMLELGPAGLEEHASAARAAREAGIDALFTFGPLMEASANAPEADSIQVRHFSDRPSLSSALLADLKPGDAVLVKGSRGMKMDEVVTALLDARGGEGGKA